MYDNVQVRAAPAEDIGLWNGMPVAFLISVGARSAA